MSQISNRIGFMYSGLPAAGKTTAAQMGAEMSGGTFLETGDVVREAAAADGVDISDGNALGNYAASERERLGNGFVSQQLVGDLARGDREIKWPLHLSGVRHVEGAIELKKYLDTSCLVVVEAPSEIRLERIRARGREGEDEFDAVDLMERDRRELNELGTASILSSNQVDAKIVNDQTEHHLREKVREILTTYGALR